MKSAPRHFLELKEVASGELRRIVDMGASFKRGEKLNGASRPLDAPHAIGSPIVCGAGVMCVILGDSVGEAREPI